MGSIGLQALDSSAVSLCSFGSQIAFSPHLARNWILRRCGNPGKWVWDDVSDRISSCTTLFSDEIVIVDVAYSM